MIGEALAAAAFGLGADASAVLARLGGPIGDEARAAFASLSGDSRRTRASWAAAARAPLPAGLRGVDPSWIESALVGLPDAARVAVAGGAGDPVAVWLARWACARIPPMPAIRRGRVESLDDALALPAADLAAWLEAIGADQLAVALAAAGGEALASAVRVLGEPLAAAARRTRPAGPTRAVIARCGGIALDDVALVRIGARAIAPHVFARALARERMMLRLPRPLGIAVGAELAAFAGDPIDRCPPLAR